MDLFHTPAPLTQRWMTLPTEAASGAPRFQCSHCGDRAARPLPWILHRADCVVDPRLTPGKKLRYLVQAIDLKYADAVKARVRRQLDEGFC